MNVTGEGGTALYSGCMEELLLQSPAPPSACQHGWSQAPLLVQEAVSMCGAGARHACACLLGPLLLGWSNSRLSSGTMRCSASSSCACDTPLCMSAVLPVLSLLLLEAAFVCCLVGSLFQQQLWGADERAALRFRVRLSSSAMQLLWVLQRRRR